MAKSCNYRIKLALLSLAAISASVCSAYADATYIEETKVITGAQPVMFEVTPGMMRSNYEKRLSDMRDQINMGMERGWLTAAQGSDLLSWQADVLKEEQACRSAGNGMIPSDCVNQLERHVTGLAFMISREIKGGSQR